MMRAIPLAIPDVLLLEPQVFGDARGFFFESFNQRDFDALLGQTVVFVQDNHSRSGKGVLRGLHYQIQHSQGKLVRVIKGSVYDVAVDLRPSSPSFGQWVGSVLTEENKQQLWIPPGFAHGFVVLSESAEFLYKTTDYWFPQFERCIAWNDPDLAVAWPSLGAESPIISAKDAQGMSFQDACRELAAQGKNGPGAA